MATVEPKPQRLRQNAESAARALLDTLELPADTALAATGSLARRELTPYSDLDLLLIAPAGCSLSEDEARAVWEPVWSAHYRLDYSVRSPQENAAIVAQDPTSALALLDITPIAGHTELVESTRRGVLDAWRRELHRNPDAVIGTAISRWRRSGSVVSMTRPDIKNGRGGLRDVALLRGLALANVCDMPDVERHYRLLVDVRTLLHVSARRARDVLEPEFAADICVVLGYPDRYALLRALAEAGRAIDAALTAALAEIRAATSRRRTGILRRRQSIRRPIDVDVVAEAGEIVLSREPNLSDLGLPLRVAAAAARTGLPIATRTFSQLREVPPVPHRMPAPVAADFLELLTSPDHTADVITALDTHGLWEPLVPEWKHARDRMPREPTHLHTIDRHCLLTVAYCASQTTSVARPDLLLLGALYHDLGKGYDRPHSQVGAEMVARMAARLGLNLRDRACVQTLVAEHTLIAQIAARMDPSSEPAIDAFLNAVHYDVLTVELLGALTEADAKATGPGVWTATLRIARDTLVREARRRLTQLQPLPPVVAASSDLGVRTVERSSEAGAAPERVTVVEWRGDYQREIIRVLAVFGAKAWMIDEVAMVRRPDGRVEAEFTVHSTVEGTIDGADFLRTYRSGVHSTLPEVDPAPTAMLWHGTVLEVRTGDRLAALGTLLGALPEWEWLTARSLGGLMIVNAELGTAVVNNRATVERDVLRAVGRPRLV